MACTFQATIGGKFAPLIGLSDKDMDIDTMITTYNTAVTDAADEILGSSWLFFYLFVCCLLALWPPA